MNTLSNRKNLVSRCTMQGMRTEAEAAKALEVNRITIWRWIKDGRFDVQRVGGVVFIPKDEVELVKKEVKKRCTNLN